MEDIKHCKYCDITKAKTEFQKHRAKCRSCRTLETKHWKSLNSQKHLDYQKEYKRTKYQTDLSFKMKQILRSRLRKALSNNWKAGSSVELLGCSIEEFKIHIEKLFKPGMTWNNWAQDGWHVDHILPLDSFNLSDPEELKKACHFSNLQPLWYNDNCSKSNKVE